MKESTIIILIVLAFVIVGVLGIYFSSDFNFNESMLTIEADQKITEELKYSPNKPYHTLFRNFVDRVTLQNDEENSVIMNKVACSSGNPYVNTITKCYSGNMEEIRCLPYTEANEYGCNFGERYGFFPSNTYTISATYELNPSNIFRINGKDYTKFVVYSQNKHKLLSVNFKVISDKSIVKKSIYLPSENVILYIPYEGSTDGKNVINSKGFEFDSSILAALQYLLFFLPAILILFVWIIFGRDPHIEMPKQLSMIPDEVNKRKPWQISAFFNPPFAAVDKNLFAATMLDFYNRKIIDVKMEKRLFGEKLLVKINKGEEGLDQIEKHIYGILKIMEKKEREFFELKVGFGNSSEVRSRSRLLEKDVKNASKEFVSVTGIRILTIIFVISFFLVFEVFGGFSIAPIFIILLLASIVMIVIFSKMTAIFSRHNKGYYREYLHWQAFKRYLKNSFSIKDATHKTVVMWEDYLIYATALGVPQKVIKELEAKHLISATQAKMYTGIYVHTSAFAATSGAASGGHGGAGGGGVGGGGGGGR